MDQTSRPVAAFGFVLASICSFTLMAVAGRALAGQHDTFEILFFRSLIGIGIVLAVGGLAGSLGEINTRQIRLHGLRNIFHFSGQCLWFFAVMSIPLGQLFALEFTSPLWVALTAPLVLGETWRPVRGIAAVIGFAGILLVARPDTIVLSPGVVAAILCSFGFAATMLVTKILSRWNSVTCILFWLVVFQSIFGGITAGLDGHITLPTAASLPWLVVVGCTGLFAHWCLTNALKRAPASIVSPMEFLRLPAMAFTGYLLYAEPLEPAVFVGGTLVLAANLLNIFAEQRRQNAPL
ncbi:DMT family transporter [Halovulum sp. GXIMD14794]